MSEVKVLKEEENYLVRKFVLKCGNVISARRHLHRRVRFVVVSGVCGMSLGEEERVLKAGNSEIVESGDVYEIRNIGRIDLEIVEIWWGEYLGEDDVEVLKAGSLGSEVDEDLEYEINMVSEEFCIGPEC